VEGIRIRRVKFKWRASREVIQEKNAVDRRQPLINYIEEKKRRKEYKEAKVKEKESMQMEI